MRKIYVGFETYHNDLAEQMKLNTDVNFNSKTEVNGVHFGVVERVKTNTINDGARKDGKDWGVSSEKDLKEGDPLAKG